MKVETQKTRQFLSLNFGDVMSKPRIGYNNKVKTGYLLKNACYVLQKKEKKIILFSELTQPQLDRHQRSQRTWKITIAFTALSSSRFWSRHVLLSGPKLRNTNCTDMFSIGSISAVSRVRSLILPEVGGCVRAHFPEKRLVIEPMFSTAVTRHKQQTSGRLRTANNTIVKCFFKFMPLVSVSFHQSCPSFDGIRSIDNTSRQVLLSKEYFL